MTLDVVNIIQSQCRTDKETYIPWKWLAMTVGQGALALGMALSLLLLLSDPDEVLTSRYPTQSTTMERAASLPAPGSQKWHQSIRLLHARGGHRSEVLGKSSVLSMSTWKHKERTESSKKRIDYGHRNRQKLDFEQQKHPLKHQSLRHEQMQQRYHHDHFQRQLHQRLYNQQYKQRLYSLNRKVRSAFLHAELQPPKVQRSPACPQLCLCNEGKGGSVLSVNCSHRDMHEIPSLPNTALWVDLSNNQIEEITPQDFEGLQNLTSLNLSSNGIRALPTHVFSSQQQLEHLDVSRCSISQLHQDTFSGLTRLLFLDISCNLLPNIPPGVFSNLTRLEYLNLLNNNISRLEDSTFIGLSSLTFLSLQRNALKYRNETFHPLAFRGMSALKELNLQGNQLDTLDLPHIQYPDRALATLTTLFTLRMDGVPVTLGLGFQNLTNLTTLDLSGKQVDTYCDMDSWIPDNFFSNLSRCNALSIDMTACNLRRIPPLLFHPIRHVLHWLRLNDNTHLTLDGFFNSSEGLVNSSIQFLDLEEISNINGQQFIVRNDSFQYLKHTQLKSLSLCHNHIYKIETRAISDLPKSLEYLSVSFNRLQYGEFLLALIKLVNLKIFDMHNQLIYRLHDPESSVLAPPTQAHSTPGFNAGAENTTLTQSKTSPHDYNSRPRLSITTGPGKHGEHVKDSVHYVNELLEEFRNTRHLNISSSELLPYLRDYCDRLGTAPLSSGAHNKREVVALPRSLEILYFSDCKLGYSIPQVTIINNRVLRYVDLSNNLALCWDGPLRGIENCEYMDLSYNYCARVDLYFFKDATGLKTLNLRNNYLGFSLMDDKKGILFSTLKNMESIDLSQNAISTLSHQAFTQNPQLRVLNLSHNELTSFDPFLGNINNLEILDLSRNSLRGLSSENCEDFRVAKSKSSNLTVKLTQNRFVCDCEYLPFLKFLIAEPTIFYDVDEIYCTLANGSRIFKERLPALVRRMDVNCAAEELFVWVLVVTCLLIMGETTAGILYHKRWRLRYLYHLSRKAIRDHSSSELRQVYVTYDQDEAHWRQFMLSTFMPALQRMGVPHLVADSGDTLTRIARAVTASRKTVVLISRELFLVSEHEFEINFAIMKELDMRRQIVVPVIVERVDIREFPTEVQIFLREHVDRILLFENTQVFWDSLKSAIDDSEDVY